MREEEPKRAKNAKLADMVYSKLIEKLRKYNESSNDYIKAYNSCAKMYHIYDPAITLADIDFNGFTLEDLEEFFEALWGYVCVESVMDADEYANAENPLHDVILTEEFKYQLSRLPKKREPVDYF